MFGAMSIQPPMFHTDEPVPLSLGLSLTITPEGVGIGAQVHELATTELRAMTSMLLRYDQDWRAEAREALESLLNAADELQGVGPFDRPLSTHEADGAAWRASAGQPTVR